MSDDSDDAITERDELRMEVAIQTARDVLFRFEENSEGNRSVYEVLGFLLQDLLSEGLCPACLNEVIALAFSETGANVAIHNEAADSTYH